MKEDLNNFQNQNTRTVYFILDLMEVATTIHPPEEKSFANE